MLVRCGDGKARVWLGFGFPGWDVWVLEHKWQQRVPSQPLSQDRDISVSLAFKPLTFLFICVQCLGVMDAFCRVVGLMGKCGPWQRWGWILGSRSPFPLLRVSCQTPLEDSCSVPGQHFWGSAGTASAPQGCGKSMLLVGCLHPVPDPSVTSCGAVASCANPHCHDVLPKCSVCAEQVTLCSTWHFPCPQLNKGLRADRAGMMVTGRCWAGWIFHASIDLQRPVQQPCGRSCASMEQEGSLIL